MEVIKSRPWVFRYRQRRAIRRLVVALSLLTVFNVFYGASAHAQSQSAFDRLVEPSNFMGATVGEDGRATYDVTGTKVRFDFTRQNREGTIRFHCRKGVDPCGQEVRLKAEAASGGAMIFKSRSGERVLRITSAGGGTLFGGAPFVPQRIPRSGLAFERN